MIDLKKTYKTRGGAMTALYAIQLENERLRQVHGAVLSLGGSWSMADWSLEGAYSTSEHDFDLVEVLPERRVWINLYATGGINPHTSLVDAEYSRTERCLRTVTVDLNTLETIYEKI